MGASIPAPRPRLLEALRDDPDVKAALADGAVLAVVPLVFDSGKPAKANISLDAGTLAGDRRGGGRARADALGVHGERGAGEDPAGDLKCCSPIAAQTPLQAASP